MQDNFGTTNHLVGQQFQSAIPGARGPVAEEIQELMDQLARKNSWNPKP